MPFLIVFSICEMLGMGINMKKKGFISTLSLIIALCFTMVCIIAPIPLKAATPVKVIGTVYKDAVTNLMNVGILTKSDSYDPHDDVSRAEMAQILVRMLNLDHPATLKKGPTKYSDVSSGYWASGYINLVTKKKLMSALSGNKFEPGKKISYSYAVTYLLKVVGYGHKQVGNKKWPENYLTKADSIGVIGNVKWKSYSNTSSAGNIAILTWNTMNIACASSSKTLLEINYPSYASEHRKEKSVEEIAKNADSTVYIQTYNGPEKNQLIASGSGVVYSKGMIVTNAHVIDNTPRFGVIYNKNADYQEYDTSGILYYDPDVDLAVVSSPNENAPPVKLGDSSKVKVGQKVVTISSPEGIDYRNTVSEGIVSGIRNFEGHNYIQITAAVSHGSSGGALYNMYGELIGIITLKDFDGESLNLAIPINDVKAALKDNSKYNLLLNKSLSDEMNKFDFNRHTYKFSCEASFDQTNNEYVVNYYMYDENEGSKAFLSEYNNLLFKGFINKRLNDVQNLLKAKGYKNYVINLNIEDRNYILRIRNGKTEIIKNTLGSPMPSPIPYDDFAKNIINSDLKTHMIGGQSFSLESSSIYEDNSNTNYLTVDFYINEESYNAIVNLTKDAKNEEEFTNWIELLSSEVSKQYPNKNIGTFVTCFVGSFDKYSEAYDTPPYFSNLNDTTNKWDVYKDMFFYSRSIINNIDYEWLNEVPPSDGDLGPSDQ